MSTENPFISNFDDLEGLEYIASLLRLEVRSALALEADRLEPGGGIRIPKHDLRGIGLVLEANWTQLDVEAAIADAGLRPEQVDLIITAEDGFLKERAGLWGPHPVTELPKKLKLAGYKDERREVMLNEHRGFALDVYIVLNDDVDPIAYRPHRKGTILARSTFKVRPQSDTGGLDPKPLTADKVEFFELSNKTVVYIYCDTEIVTLEHLENDLEIYVHEELLASASHQRGPERDAVIGGLAIEALCQLVHIVSAELRDGVVPLDGDNSSVLRLLRRNLKAAGHPFASAELPDLIQHQPARVAGLLSGLDRRAQRLLQIVAGDPDADPTDKAEVTP